MLKELNELLDGWVRATNDGTFIILCILLPFGIWLWLPLHAIGLMINMIKNG